MAYGFNRLRIWQTGRMLLLKIHEMTDAFPIAEKGGLVKQIRNSANSVIANIAESHGRYYYLDKIRVLYTSRGEAEETRSHLRIAHDLDYINEEIYLKIDKEYEQLSRSISAYIRTLKAKSK